MRRALPVLLFLSAITASAQPTWRFHLAFENSDGARDTIWMLYDTSATLPADPFPGPNVDTYLDEGGLTLDYSQFNVWVENAVGDSTKTNAIPYSWYPIHGGTIIDAFNWIAPITIRWDTALFNAPYLPATDTIRRATMGGTYFFFNNNRPEIHAFDMFLTDSVVISADADLLFPFGVYFSGEPWTGIVEDPTSVQSEPTPNPTESLVYLPIPEPLQTLWVTDIFGREVMGPVIQPAGNLLDLSALPDGSYILRGITVSKRLYHEKVIKQQCY